MGGAKTRVTVAGTFLKELSLTSTSALAWSLPVLVTVLDVAKPARVSFWTTRLVPE